jgi:hypothetical protein
MSRHRNRNTAECDAQKGQCGEHGFPHRALHRFPCSGLYVPPVVLPLMSGGPMPQGLPQQGMRRTEVFQGPDFAGRRRNPAAPSLRCRITAPSEAALRRPALGNGKNRTRHERQASAGPEGDDTIVTGACQRIPVGSHKGRQCRPPPRFTGRTTRCRWPRFPSSRT